MNAPLEGRVLSLEKRLEKIEQLLSRNAPAEIVKPKKLSAREFLQGRTPTSEAQKVLALAFYLERWEGLSSFNVSDLESVFRSAREKLPKNMNDAVNKNIARGFIMEAEQKKDSKKAWNLTATGENFVEN